MASSVLNLSKIHHLPSSKENSELFLSAQTPFIATEKRPEQLAAGKAPHSAGAVFLSGVCGFPKYKTRWDFAIV